MTSALGQTFPSVDGTNNINIKSEQPTGVSLVNFGPMMFSNDDQVLLGVTRLNIAPLGHGSITNANSRGQIDPSNPPIAGIDGVALADGLTTQYLYDSNLTDGQGLDSSAGVTVSKLGTGGTGTFSVSLSNAIAKLADTQANGGAGITFSSTTAPGRASVVINGEDEISFSITDSVGRTVMSGKLNNYRGSGSTALNTLASWSTVQHDATTNLSGYGTVLVTRSIDALGNATKSWTDASGRTLRSLDQLDNATALTYDAAGNQLSVRDANNVGADMLYDALSRNTQRTDTFGDVTKTEYDRAGNAIKQIDAKNKNTLITFDARNRRKLTTDRISAATAFAYTALSQLASLTDAENQTTSYTYDSRGLKLTETYPDHTSGTSVGQTGYGIVTFVYDNSGRVLRKQDQLGDTVTYNYDLVGRMTSRNYRTAANSPSGTIADTDTFTFDRSGRMLSAVSGRYTNTVAYTFDPAGRKASEALTISSVTYTIGQAYNARNELTTVTYPDSSTSTRSYHSTGALNELALDGSTISTRSYDAGRRQTTEVLGNGITETRSYRSDNLLSGISYSNTSLGDLSYTWDANKNKTSESITGVMSGYGFTSGGTTYDFEDRLTGYARASGTFNQSWNLTSVGDWTSVTTNGIAQNRTHGPTHELLTAGGSSVVTDVKGNMTVIPAVLSGLQPPASSLFLSWDFDNKLASADIDANGTADVSFQYDALGRRVARTGTGGSFVFVQMDQQTIADYPVGGAASTPTYRYVYASYIDEPVVRKGAGAGGTLVYFHRNQQYSVTAITTSTGTIAERYAYSAYGQPTVLDASASVLSSSAINNCYTYTGREWDATLALHHFRARWMSPSAGRFLGRDPLRMIPNNNMYALNLDNALSAVDPSGKLSQKLIEHNKIPLDGPGCGQYFAPFKWQLEEGETDGFILQIVNRKFACKECGLTDNQIFCQENPRTEIEILKPNNKALCQGGYWEMWTLPAGEFPLLDVFADSGCQAPSRGNSTKIGSAFFVPRDQLTEEQIEKLKRLMKTGDYGIAQAHDLPSACADNIELQELLQQIGIPTNGKTGKKTKFSNTTKQTSISWNCCPSPDKWNEGKVRVFVDGKDSLAQR